MDYNFPSFKYYFSGVLLLFLVFLLCWLPSAQVNLFLTPEPLIVDFKVNIDISVDKVFTHLNKIPAQILPIVKARSQEDFVILDQLTFNEGNKVLTFSRNDLENLIKNKVENILKNGLEKTEIKKFHPQNWEFTILKTDSMPQKATLQVNIHEKSYPCVDQKRLTHSLVFLKKDKALAKIYKNVNVEKVSIETTPSFYNRLPIFQQRIFFVVKTKSQDN